MTKELKEVLLRGFKEMLEDIQTSESLASDYEHKNNEKEETYWRERAKNQQETILKAIEDLIENK